MAKFCTNCGAEINKTYKFCPECGAEIISEENDGSEKTNRERTTEEKESWVIICDNCGDENSISDNVCKSCGILIKTKTDDRSTHRNKPVSSKEKVQKTAGRSGYRKTRQKKNRGDSRGETKRESKAIDIKILYLIVSVITIFVIVLLYSSGVFDSDVTNISNLNSGNNQSNRSGIDLNSLQKINDLQARVDANPDDMGLLLELAHLKNDSGFYENAIQLYRKYLEKVSENADARIDMGVCYFNIGNYETAISEMKKALEFQPDHQIGHLNLGIVNLTAGNVEEAKSWFQKTIELGPDTKIGQRAKELLNTHNL